MARTNEMVLIKTLNRWRLKLATGNPAFLPDAMICVCSSLGDVLHDPPYITLLANRS